MLIQLSDPHIVAPGQRLLGHIDTPAHLAAAVQSVLALQPAAQAVVVTGDLVDRGTAAEYLHLQALLAPLTCPVWLLPGNHDDAAAMRATLPGHEELRPTADAAHADGDALAGFVLWTREVAGLRVVALDTVVPGAAHGSLCQHRLAWLDRTLAQAPQQPTVLAMHHPPFVTGIQHMDGMGLRLGAEALASVLRRHSQVERVICGHLHRSIVRRFGGTVAMTAPSTAHQIVLDLRNGAPAAFRFEPPGFVVHTLRDGAVVSHIAAVGDHGPAHSFG